MITGTKCPVGCRGPIALPCKTAFGLSLCKAVCQKIKIVGGYEIKIRFGKDWDLVKCVRHRARSGKNSPKGKERERNNFQRSGNPVSDNPASVARELPCSKIGSCSERVPKKNPPSIAVYSQADLDDLLSLIALKMAARQIIATNAQGLKAEEIGKEKTDRATILNEAKKLEAYVKKSIEDNLEDELYVYQ